MNICVAFLKHSMERCMRYIFSLSQKLFPFQTKQKAGVFTSTIDKCSSDFNKQSFGSTPQRLNGRFPYNIYIIIRIYNCIASVFKYLNLTRSQYIMKLSTHELYKIQPDIYESALVKI